MSKRAIKSRPEKVKKPFVIAGRMAEAGLVAYSQHAIERMIERGIEETDVVYVVSTGTHKPSRDRYSDREGWSYCFEGLDIDQEPFLRISVELKGKHLYSDSD